MTLAKTAGVLVLAFLAVIGCGNGSADGMDDGGLDAGDQGGDGCPFAECRGVCCSYGEYCGLEGTCIPEVKLTASDGAAADAFGTSVSTSGAHVVVGAPGNDGNGAAYVFHNDGTGWTQQAKLTALDGESNDLFGVSVVTNGEHIIVGAHEHQAQTGAAYVFCDDGQGWAETAKLGASDGQPGDWFGRSVGLSGYRVVVGAPAADGNGPGSGCAYVFHYDGENWLEAAKIAASDGETGDQFGLSASISWDYAVIGAPGSDSGCAYIFQFDGQNWAEHAKLTASDGAPGDGFGISVSMSGNYAIVGSLFDDDAGQSSGSAYVFERVGPDWTERAKLCASDGSADDEFGASVSISGECAVVGASGDDDNGDSSGSAYVLCYDGENWTRLIKLAAVGGAAGDGFGGSVSISGATLVVGASGDDDKGQDSGCALVY